MTSSWPNISSSDKAPSPSPPPAPLNSINDTTSLRLHPSRLSSTNGTTSLPRWRRETPTTRTRPAWHRPRAWLQGSARPRAIALLHLRDRRRRPPSRAPRPTRPSSRCSVPWTKLVRLGHKSGSCCDTRARHYWSSHELLGDCTCARSFGLTVTPRNRSTFRKGTFRRPRQRRLDSL